MKINPILAIDSYKLAHISMYPEQIKETYLNLTPRVMKYFQRIVMGAAPKGMFTIETFVKQHLITINKDTDDKPIHTEPTLR